MNSTAKSTSTEIAIAPEASTPTAISTIRITEAALKQIAETIGHTHPEAGGLLAGNRATQTITHYVYDKTAHATGATYSPNTEVINTTLDQWDAKGGPKLIGFIHSHPGAYGRPSPGDEHYAARILKALPALEVFFMPIAFFARGDERGKCVFTLAPFVATRAEGDRVEVSRIPLTIVNAQNEELQTVDEWTCPVSDPRTSTSDPYQDDTFVRVTGAYNLEWLRRSRVVAVGVGGASDFIECLSRAGVGEFVLIDPDTVSITNLATQQTYRWDLGRPKVEALADRLYGINPSVIIRSLAKRLDAGMTDDTVKSLLFDSFVEGGAKPNTTLLCGFTDSFPAQARINRLALQYAVPSLCAQVYREGRGAEVTFTHPDLTPACHRCALASRYEAYEAGKRDDVGSSGTPIFATSRLNAIKGFVALGLLHADTGHPRWSTMIRRAATRNLVMVRMDPDFCQHLGLDTFERVLGRDNPRTFFDETVWLPVTPDDGQNGTPVCPDCGGTGHLRAVRGRFADTATGGLVQSVEAAFRPATPKADLICAL
ncbi:MAG: ThiF family adenylyltransferase [bacterium]